VDHVTKEECFSGFAEFGDSDVRQHFLLQDFLGVLDTLFLCNTWKTRNRLVSKDQDSQQNDKTKLDNFINSIKRIRLGEPLGQGARRLTE